MENLLKLSREIDFAVKENIRLNQELAYCKRVLLAIIFGQNGEVDYSYFPDNLNEVYLSGVSFPSGGGKIEAWQTIGGEPNRLFDFEDLK